ncbi:MAG: ABC transporter substrate-binding protein [Gammaproteobacteria bacterium]|jgi:phospholipid transport system substrate-binding protein
MKKVLVSLTTIVIFLCINTAYAYSDYSMPYGDRGDRYPARSSRYADIPDPAAELKQAVSDLEKFIKGKDVAHPGMLRSFLEKKIFPHFDFDAMSEWITGPYARYMSTEDKIEFQTKLQETFLTALVKHMGGFDPDNTSLRYDRTRFRGRGDEAVVRVNVIRKQQPPARLDFGMRRDDGKWRIVDVKANGTSAVLYYRRHFIAELRGYGDRDFDQRRQEYLR